MFRHALFRPLKIWRLRIIRSAVATALENLFYHLTSWRLRTSGAPVRQNCAAARTTTARSPYQSQPDKAFWRTGVLGQRSEAVAGLYEPKFPIPKSTRIATAGSCFAQHITRQLRARKFSLIDAEPPPPGLENEAAAQFGYGLYSARYGNIYTSRQLLQLIREARGEFRPADPVWEKNGRYYDSQRPSVEPDGLSRPELVLDHRKYHLTKVLQVFETADLVAFTLGLTETWVHAGTGTTYPTAPGTIAGSYDPAVHRFRNLTCQEVYDDMSAFFDLARDFNPDIRFLLTISPVPLTATATDQHVLAATTYSKAALRAAAGQLFHERADVDYFPSYEIVTNILAAGKYFESNLRSVRPEGVQAAMNTFFAAHDAGGPELPISGKYIGQADAGEPMSAADSEDDIVCEEVLLEAFTR